MKRALAILLLIGLVVGVAACGTPIKTTKISDHPLTYLICDDGEQDCSGPNPEKGIDDVCLPKRRSIVAVKVDHNQVVVTCGPRRKATR